MFLIVSLRNQGIAASFREARARGRCSSLAIRRHLVRRPDAGVTGYREGAEGGVGEGKVALSV